MRIHVWAALAAGVSLVACGAEEGPPDARSFEEEAAPVEVGDDPIAYVGHGAMFGHDGTELEPDAAFVFATQSRYRRMLEAEVDPEVAARARALVNELVREGLTDDERAFLDTRLVRGLAELSPRPEARDFIAKSITLHDAYVRLRNTSVDAYPAIDARIRSAGLGPAPQPMSGTASLAASYEASCLAAGVPVPPAWGTSQWINRGPLITPFTGQGIGVYYYSSDSPRGTCIALPRLSGSTIALLGIICHGVDTSKACFWDNSNVPVGAVVPISNFVKGNTPEIANGGKCTECHAGENPFIVYPNTALDLSGVVPSSRWSTKNWYDPLIHANLPQNPGPTNAIAVLSLPTTQGSCHGCHAAQRLPELSSSTKYCDAVLNRAITSTMPPGNPGDPAYTLHAMTLKARCSTSLSQRCAPDNAKICAQAGGYCEQAFDTVGFRHDLCRWPDAKSPTACASTAGIWTTSTSGFALGWPTAVPGGAAGACITQMRNIGGRRSTESACSTANRELCRSVGGFCEDATSKTGANHQLCRWPNHGTPSKCASTAGIWTDRTSGFALDWPTAVRNDEGGSCITQMRNLGGLPN